MTHRGPFQPLLFCDSVPTGDEWRGGAGECSCSCGFLTDQQRLNPLLSHSSSWDVSGLGILVLSSVEEGDGHIP